MKPAVMDDLSADDIIIASFPLLIYIHIKVIYIATWAQLFLGKALYVPSLYVFLIITF